MLHACACVRRHPSSLSRVQPRQRGSECVRPSACLDPLLWQQGQEHGSELVRDGEEGCCGGGAHSGFRSAGGHLASVAAACSPPTSWALPLPLAPRPSIRPPLHVASSAGELESSPSRLGEPASGRCPMLVSTSGRRKKGVEDDTWAL